MKPIIAGIALLTLFAAKALAADDLINVAGFANGGLIESSTSDYPGWEADFLLDESPSKGWASQKDVKAPLTIVISLAERSVIQSLAFDAGEDGPKRAAKDIDVSVSDLSAAAGFNPVASVSLKEGANNQQFALKSPATGRWIKLVIKTNNGASDYFELMDFRAMGRMLAQSPLPANLSGTYVSAAYGTFHLLQKGAELSGCYEFGGGGLVQGGLESHLMRLTWSEPKNNAGTGPAVMVLKRNGRDFKGWWRHANDQNWNPNWDLTRTSDQVGACPNWNPNGSVIASELANAGRSRLYGINFDLDSAALRSDALPEVGELFSVLKADPKLRIAIEGHTDSTGTAAHNLDLSKRRAAAVMAELTRRGIEAGRMTADGFGQTKPIAGNDTEIGRAQNRRVEVVRQ